jgi:serine O-acetyltransferase
MNILKEDILRTYRLTSGSKLKRIIGCYRSPGVHAIINVRFGQWIKKQNILIKFLLLPLYYLQFRFMRTNWGIDIPVSTQIGKGCYIGHFGGIIISPKAIIGENANISQQITIGVSGKGENRGVPIIGNNVYIAPGAKIFGKITIGDNVKIGANAVVYKDVPNNAIVVLDPGMKIIIKD